MKTEVRCYGHLEQRSGPGTIWEGTTPFEPMPGFSDWVLPANGIYRGARYYLSFTISDERDHLDRRIGTHASRVEGKAEFERDRIRVRAPEMGAEGLEGVFGTIGSMSAMVDVEAYEQGECWATVSFEYDPGLTVLRNEITPEALVELEETSAYETPADQVPFEKSELPSSRPSADPDRLRRDFPDLGLTLEHSGVLSNGERELRLPMGARHGFVRDETLVLHVDPRRGGVSDPTVEIPEDRNIVGIGPDCDLKWTIDTSSYDTPGLLWGPFTKDGDVFVESSYSSDFFEIDAETGTIVDAIEKY